MINLKSKRKLFFVLLYSLSLISLAEEENDFSPKKSDREERDPISRIDTNGDGVISLDEFSAAPKLNGAPDEKISKMFDYLDKDKDGTLSDTELPRPPKHGPHPRRHFREHRPRSHTHDGGREHKKPPRHFKGPPPGNNPRRKMMGSKERLERLDNDGDGQISFDEFKLGERAKKLPKSEQQTLFDRLDQNGDGVISPEDRRMKPPRQERRNDSSE